MFEYFRLLHQEINLPLLRYLNHFVENEYVAKTVYMLSDLPIFLIPLVLIGQWLYAVKEKNNVSKEKLLFVFSSMVLWFIINIIIQSQVHISRPEEALDGSGKLILKHIPDASFPSDHACVSMAFIVALRLFGFRMTAIILLPLMILMNVARIAWGVHWPFDIVGGMLIGWLSAFLVYKMRNFSIIIKMFSYIIKIASYIKL